MPFSDAYANSILNYALAKGSLNSISQVYIGLSSTNPETGSFTELSGNGYSRILIAKSGSTEPSVIGSASGRTIQNTKQINWVKASGNWSQALGFGLFTSETGGQPYFYGALETPVTVEAGDVALFDPSTLKISFPATDVQM